MRSYWTHGLGGIGSLVLEEMPPPAAPGPGQALVALRAASLNYRDLLFIGGALRQIALPDLIPCSDGAGEVIAIGDGVWRVRPGDRVALTFNPDWIAGAWRPSPGAPGRGGALHGVMRDAMLVDQSELVVLPLHLSFEQGAALPCAAVTAWHALCGPAPLMPGMTILLQGAGGVSVFALQFAKLFGARVIMTSSSPERCARLRALGADDTIDYCAQPDWHIRVRDLTDGQGVDLTVEMGGAKTLDQSLAATRTGGRVSLVGLLTGPPDATRHLFSTGVDIATIKVGSRADFEAMLRAMAFHRLEPVIDRRYRFEALPDALRYLESGRHFGKIVIAF